MKEKTSSYQKENPESIKTLFSQIAGRYDLTNSVISLGIHHYWNSQLVNRLRNHPQKGIFLDLCAGTGAISKTYLNSRSDLKEVILIDFCAEMLEIAKERNLESLTPSISYFTADACELPLEDESVDQIAIAYGIRNIRDPAKALSECYRVLKPGGQLAILELTRVENKWLRKGHQLYLNLALPVLGKWMTQNKKAYDYLKDSIEKFTCPQKLKQIALKMGFKSVELFPLTGRSATLLDISKSKP